MERRLVLVRSRKREISFLSILLFFPYSRRDFGAKMFLPKKCFWHGELEELHRDGEAKSGCFGLVKALNPE